MTSFVKHYRPMNMAERQRRHDIKDLEAQVGAQDAASCTQHENNKNDLGGGRRSVLTARRPLRPCRAFHRAHDETHLTIRGSSPNVSISIRSGKAHPRRAQFYVRRVCRCECSTAQTTNFRRSCAQNEANKFLHIPDVLRMNRTIFIPVSVAVAVPPPGPPLGCAHSESNRKG